jgi:DNA-binding NarL/FixJ family response regulator
MPYTRSHKIEDNITELSSLSRSELIARCVMRQVDDPAYVPSECLLYFIRASRTDSSDAHFEQLYKLLAERVLRICLKAVSADGNKTHLIQLIRDEAIGRFAELLANDRASYCEQLDFFEVRFNQALQAMLSDVRRQVMRNEHRLTTLDDQMTGEPKVEVERAAGSFDPFNTSAFDDNDYRSCLYTAIDTLPLEQRRIIEMIRQGIPIDSKEPGILTIAKALGKSEKTIRTHRDKAYAALRAVFNQGEEV